MKFLVSVIIISQLLFPIATFAQQSDTVLRCSCSFTAALTTPQHAGENFADIPDQDIRTFSVRYKKDDGTYATNFVYPTEGLSDGEEFGPFLALYTIVDALKADPKVESYDTQQGIMKYDGQQYVSINAIDTFKGKKVFKQGVDDNWKVNFSQSPVCVPKTFTNEYGIAATSFGSGYIMFDMKCTDIITDVTTQNNAGSAVGSFPSTKALNPLHTTSIPVLFGRAITILLGVLGSVAIAIFIYGGFMWMISMGNSEQADKGLKTIVWGAMGVFVIFASYAVVQFILNAFK